MTKRLTWEFKQEQLRRHISTDSMDNMLQWSTMQESFFVGDTRAARNELASLSPRMLKAVEDPGIGSPSLMSGAKTSGTYVRQAFALQVWEEQAEQNTQEMTRIFEFGGGYGAMPVVCNRLGFSGLYTIYDFPIVNKIQRWYLGQANVRNTKFLSKAGTGSYDLFISLCGLSEAPVDTRVAVLDAHPAIHYLILFQYEWDRVDNMIWFEDWFNDNNLYYTIVRSPYEKGQHYLIC